MKRIFILFVLISSCNSAPEGFCDCMKSGEELNEITQTVLSGKASDDVKMKMMKIRDEKKKACAQFETASGKNMMEWKKACEN